MTFLFATALFVNALLLFLVQPMFAKLLLPPFGGSPAVWTTCMLFFQSALLAGYAYSHSVVKLRKPWQQVALHLVIITLPFLTLPIAVSTNASQTDDPIQSVLWLSVIAVGAPFFALSTGAPLLQRWFAASHRQAIDPYFLYVASNVGSFASLLLYPTVVEPALALSTQTQAWSIGYAAAVLLTLTCAVVMWWRAPRAAATSTAEIQTSGDAVTWPRRARWIALAFVPSSLMLAVTAYLSTDVAAVPLLWVGPLSLYLITFVVTFSSYSARVVAVGRRFFAIVLLYLTWLLISEARLPLAQMAVLHLVAFFVLALLCHGALAEDRPDATHLTDFYLSVAVGGALGGVFNSLLAPMMFDSVLEYPIALACAVWLLTMRPGTQPTPARPGWWPKFAVIVALTVTALLWPGKGVPIMLLTAGLLLLAVMVSLSVSREPRRFGVCVLLMLGLYLAVGGRSSRDLAYASRTFFGTYRVVPDTAPPSFTLYHGTTIHGRQHVSSNEPLTYFHRNSPIAQVLTTRPTGTVTSVGVIGLGTGTLAAYAQSGQQWTFYEIDPEVERIARDARYFTHLQACGAACAVVVGDARISLQHRPDTFDVFVVDAFSSDAIPIHLLTREAVELYFSRLNPGGVLALHISNNHLDLRPVVAGIMRDLGLVARARYAPAVDTAKGHFASHWAVLARSEAALGPLADDTSWDRLQPDGRRVWTDDFSNLWSVITWGQ